MFTNGFRKPKKSQIYLYCGSLLLFHCVRKSYQLFLHLIWKLKEILIWIKECNNNFLYNKTIIASKQGLCFSIFNPTLIDLKDIFNTSLKKASLAFPIRSAGYVIGSLSCESKKSVLRYHDYYSMKYIKSIIFSSKLKPCFKINLWNAKTFFTSEVNEIITQKVIYRNQVVLRVNVTKLCIDLTNI